MSDGNPLVSTGKEVVRRVRIDLFKTTGKWYTTEELEVVEASGKPRLPFREFLGNVFSVSAEHTRYAGMTAVCLDWGGVPALAEVPEANILPRDKEWVEALNAEFKIGGAIRPEDNQWVKEKTTYPEQWARILRLATNSGGAKLHDYKPPPTVKLAATYTRNCNRHVDCDAAEYSLRAKGREVRSNFHCHSDDCEDCFPK